jgi:hypothetical protein
MEDKYFQCFSLKLYKFLVSKNFIPVKQREDLKNPNNYVWDFVNCNEIQETFKEFKEKYGDIKFKKH